MRCSVAVLGTHSTAVVLEASVWGWLWHPRLVYQRAMRWHGILMGMIVGLVVGMAAGVRFKEPLLLAVSGPPPTPTVLSVNARTFDAVVRAATATEQALAVGVNLDGLSDRAQALATEIALTADAVRTDQEREILVRFASALDAYLQSLELWNTKIRRNERYLPISEDIVAKYKIPDSISTINKVPYSKERRKEYRIDSVNQWLWQVATFDLNEARRLLAASAPSP